MSGQLLKQVQQEYYVQNQDLGTPWAPKFKIFVGGYGESVQVRILDTININLIPMKYVSFFNYERQKSTTSDKLFVSDYGQVEILGIMTLWIKLNSFYGRPIVNSFETEGAILMKYHVVNIDCHMTLGRDILRELNLNLEYPTNFLEDKKYVNWTLQKRLQGSWALVGKVTKIGPWYGDDLCNA